MHLSNVNMAALMGILTLSWAACGVEQADGGSQQAGTPSSDDGSQPGTNGTQPSEDKQQLAHPPQTTKGFIECGTQAGNTLYCQPGMRCADANTSRCDEGCTSNAACPTGYKCEKPPGVANISNFCLPVGTPTTSNAERAGYSFCGYKNAEVFTCTPGSYCNDPVQNDCATGCLTYINCAEGEYCDFASATAHWKGACKLGQSVPSHGGGGGGPCPGGESFCCCVNGAYYSCPSEPALDQCDGGMGACVDQCAFDDFDCMGACFENSGTMDPSACTAAPALNNSCD